MRRLLVFFFLCLIPAHLVAKEEGDSLESETASLLNSQKLAQPKPRAGVKRDATTVLAKYLLKTAKATLGIQKAKEWKQRTAQSLAFLAVLRSVIDPRKSWDVEEVVNHALSATSIGLWVSGYAIPYLWIPSGVYTVYKAPPVRSRVDETVYGKYINEAKDVVEAVEFTNSKLVNKPYIICNKYDSKEDIAKGKKPVYWNYVTKEDDHYDLDAFSSERYFKQYDGRGKSRSYFVVPGRWVKIQTGYWDHTVRFATLIDPVELQLVCNTHMIRNKKIQSPKEEELVVAQVGYSGVTASYPVYYYVSVNAHLDDGSSLQLAKKLSPDKGMFKEQKTVKESGDYIEDLLMSSQLTRYLHADFDHEKNRWKADLFGGRWDIVGELDTVYELYRTAWKAYQWKYEGGAGIPKNQAFGLGLKTLASADTIIKSVSDLKFVPVLGYVHHIRAAYFLVNAVSFVAPYFYPTGNQSVPYGEYLEPKEVYTMSHFSETKVNKSYLSCRAFENDQKLERGQALYWNWAHSESLVKGSDQMPSNAQEYGRYVTVNGRWIMETKKDGVRYSFATLEDPIRLLTTCYKSLHKDYDDGRITKAMMDKIGPHIMVTVGNTQLVESAYPIQYFIPINNSELDSSSDDKAVLFKPDFKKIAEQEKNRKPAHEVEKKALNGIVSEQATAQKSPDGELKVEEPKRLVFLDAGSSGTRAFIYKWTWPKDHKVPLLTIETCGDDPCVYKVEGGIGHLVDDPIKMKEHLQSLIHFVNERFEYDEVVLPVYFMATGGVRKLPEEKQKTLMDAVRAQLTQEAIFDVKDVRPLEGKWEGIFGWMTANGLMGRFEKPQQGTVGIVEMGGASVQVTFSPVKSPEEDGVELKIGGVKYEIYSHVYEGLGINDAREAIGVTNENSGCYVAPGKAVEFETCFDEVEQELRVQNQTCVGNCGVRDAYMPDIQGKFIAVSGLPYILNKHGFIPSMNAPISPEELKSFTKKTCAANNLQGDPVDSEAQLACPDLIHIQNLLIGKEGKTGLGFGNKTVELVGRSDINGVMTNWTYGAALLKIIKNKDM